MHTAFEKLALSLGMDIEKCVAIECYTDEQQCEFPRCLKHDPTCMKRAEGKPKFYYYKQTADAFKIWEAAKKG